ncbi:MAG: PIN domain-containing protein [Phycisphaerales bacterium]
MKVLLDANRYRDLMEGDDDARGRLERAAWIVLSFVTLGELRAGFCAGSRGEHNEQTLGRFLHEPNVTTLWADDQTTTHYARLFAHLRRMGKPIPTNGLWLAALAVQHDLTLYSRDRHFDHIPNLRRL